MESINYRFFQAVNGMAGHYTLLDEIMKLLSNYGEYIFFIGIIAYWFTRSMSRRLMVVESLLSACVALGIASILGTLFYQNRPFVDHQVHLLIQHAANASFPSDHATAAFVVATAIWCNRRREGWAWLALAACISVSRVWTGVHYPVDVIAGFILGTGIAITIHTFLSKVNWIQRSFTRVIGLYEGVERKVWPIHSKLSR